jgi:hypothetical protein
MDGESPSPNGVNGRATNGQFTRGNGGGPGNPFAKQVAALRSVLMEKCSPEDLGEIVTKLVALAKAGDLQAAKLILDRTLGKTVTVDLPAAAELEEQPCDVATVTVANMEAYRERLRLLAIQRGYQDRRIEATS